MTDEQKKRLTDRSQLMFKVHEIVRSSTEDPAESLIRHGEALVKIGEALKGVSHGDAVAAIRATQLMLGTPPQQDDK